MNTIQIKGHIQKENNTDFSENEMIDLVSDLSEFLESKGYTFTGKSDLIKANG